jgi:hypothetical protein
MVLQSKFSHKSESKISHKSGTTDHSLQIYPNKNGRPKTSGTYRTWALVIYLPYQALLCVAHLNFLKQYCEGRTQNGLESNDIGLESNDIVEESNDGQHNNLHLAQTWITY